MRRARGTQLVKLVDFRDSDGDGLGQLRKLSRRLPIINPRCWRPPRTEGASAHGPGRCRPLPLCKEWINRALRRAPPRPCTVRQCPWRQHVRCSPWRREWRRLWGGHGFFQTFIWGRHCRSYSSGERKCGNQVTWRSDVKALPIQTLYTTDQTCVTLALGRHDHTSPGPASRGVGRPQRFHGTWKVAFCLRSRLGRS